jgi:hypothetical protein
MAMTIKVLFDPERPSTSCRSAQRLRQSILAAFPMRTLLLACPGIIAFSALSHAGPLAPKDIQATFFTGQPFTASTPKGIKYKMVFTTDGKITREPEGRAGTKDEGTWTSSKDGFCTTWKGSKSNCYTVVTSESNKWSVMKGKEVVANWSK